jgi:branched-chain amino acid transport system permease protein
MAAFALSAGVAGLAGALLVETTQFVSLEVVSFDRAAAGLIIVALGGAGTLIGPMVGAVVFIVGRDYISAIDPLYWYFWLGLLLSGSVFAAPAFKAIRAALASRAHSRRAVS